MHTLTKQRKTPGVRRYDHQPDHGEPGMLQVVTLVLWLSFLAIGVIGFVFGPKPPPPTKPRKATEPPPVQAMVMQVKLELPPPPTDSAPPPAMFADAVIPDVPDLPIVAAPSPAIVFAQPIEGPVRIGSGRIATPARLAAFRPQVRKLVQAPDDVHQPDIGYPPEAQAAGQEGDVVVQFSVASDGTVRFARISSPCRWPLLNQAVLAAVRGYTWQLPPGVTWEKTVHFHRR